MRKDPLDELTRDLKAARRVLEKDGAAGIKWAIAWLQEAEDRAKEVEACHQEWLGQLRQIRNAVNLWRVE